MEWLNRGAGRRAGPMPWFILEANIAHYKQLLARETDPEKIAMLRKLLAEEEARLAEYNRHHPPSQRKRG